jgi:hypothetical protein
MVTMTNTKRTQSKKKMTEEKMIMVVTLLQKLQQYAKTIEYQRWKSHQGNRRIVDDCSNSFKLQRVQR